MQNAIVPIDTLLASLVVSSFEDEHYKRVHALS